AALAPRRAAAPLPESARQTPRSWPLDPQRHELVDGHRLEPAEIGEQRLELRGTRLVETAAHIAAELVDEQRNALRAATSMPERVVDRDAPSRRPVREAHLDGVADRALIGVVVVPRESLVLRNRHARPERIDA